MKQNIAKNSPTAKPGNKGGKKNHELMNQSKDNNAVKQALKKEDQPSREEDLSPLHNNKETGTTGGDQRTRENDPEEG